MKRFFLMVVLPLLAIGALAQIQVPQLNEDTCFTFLLANDLGRNGYYDQKPIAELMGELAAEIDVEFVAAAGDVHHFEGIVSTQDPLWLTNYEQVYSHPELMIPWYPILGNHEYRGNTHAVIDYSKISRRWEMPARYYTKEFNVNGKESVLLVFIDTPPLIDKYREDTEQYPDAAKQNMKKQLNWLDKVLARSNAKWKIVIGHHPVFAESSKSEQERTDLQKRILPIMEKYRVDAYLCGHIHNFQHIKPQSSSIDFLVNSSASLARKVKPIEGTRFCSGDTGFTVVSLSDNALTFFLMNVQGQIIYSYTRTKE